MRLVLTVLGEAERFGAVMLNGADVVEVLSDNGRAAGVAFVEAESGERFEVGADHVVNATGVWADQIRPEVVEEEDVPRIAPSRGTHLILDQADLPMGHAACIVPAGEGRMIFSLPWYGRTLVGTTDNDFDGDIAHPQPAGEDVGYLLEAVNEFFGTSLTAVRPGRRLRRRAAADLQRRPAQVGRHLPQGGAVRDLLGDADDHRRQADHLAADGEADRRPPGRARGPRGALPHGRDPAGDGGAGPRTWRRPTGWGRRRSPSSPSATGTPPAPSSTSPGRTRSWPAPIVPGRPDLLAEVAIAARREQARSVADVLLRRTRLGILAAPQLRDAAAVRPVAEVLGAELGWSRRRVKQEAEAWPGAAAARGHRPRAGSVLAG